MTYWTDEKISSSRYYQDEVYKIVNTIIRICQIRSVLDIGCGTCIKLNRYVVPYVDRVTGIDKEIINNHYNINKIRLDIDNDNIENITDKYGLIICSDVIEHIRRYDKLLRLIDKSSLKNSYIIISTPNKKLSKCNNIYHIREFEKNEILDMFCNYGFKLLFYKSVDCMSFPFKDIRMMYKYFSLLKENRLKKDLVFCFYKDQ